MAGEWIKIEVGTPDKPEVIRMARILQADRDLVFGKLCRLWSWFDRNSVDGTVDGVVSTDVDAVVGMPGFMVALKTVSWGDFDDAAERVWLINFAAHNGETAKQRATKNKRQAKWRKGSGESEPAPADQKHVDGDASTEASTREEKRREEKINTPGGVFTTGQQRDQRFSMLATWTPSPDIVKLTIARGVGDKFVADSVPEFILYWRERPATTDYQGGWDNRFLKHAVRQWERFRAALNTKQPEPLPRDFYPDDQTVADLHVAGVPEESILGSVNSFVRYWTENAGSSLNWNFKFYGWALDDHMRHGQSSTSLEAKLTDRSWADEGAHA